MDTIAERLPLHASKTFMYLFSNSHIYALWAATQAAGSYSVTTLKILCRHVLGTRLHSNSASRKSFVTMPSFCCLLKLVSNVFFCECCRPFVGSSKLDASLKRLPVGKWFGLAISATRFPSKASHYFSAREPLLAIAVMWPGTVSHLSEELQKHGPAAVQLAADMCLAERASDDLSEQVSRHPQNVMETLKELKEWFQAAGTRTVEKSQKEQERVSMLLNIVNGSSMSVPKETPEASSSD